MFAGNKAEKRSEYVGIDTDHVLDKPLASFCRDEACERLDLHTCSPKNCLRRRGREALYGTRSRKYGAEPWRAYNHEALRDSAFKATSLIEPRNFATVFSLVENDYGSCCERSLHRHLGALRTEGKIVRMDFGGRIHAYLRAGSRLIHDRDLVLEQIIDLHSAAA
jgi:hypothetical protein